MLLRAGELVDIRRRLRRVAGRHDLASVLVSAFDPRTRMLPLVYVSTHMVPAAPRAIAAAMVESGFDKTRVVLGQWNPHFRPSQARVDGRLPDLFMLSAIQVHTAAAKALVRDICRIDPAHRPLIIAGGPKAIYEPWDLFAPSVGGPAGIDVAVTGEEYVLLNLLEVVLSIRARGESMRNAFSRAREAGLLADVPGLVYASADGMPEELIDTGPQRLVADLDELPGPVHGYRVLEPPSRKATLAPAPLSPHQVRRQRLLGTLVLTSGCKSACPYCPIPAYTQRQLRFKSGPCVAEEIIRIHREYGLTDFFGADDNFFCDHGRALEIVQALAAARIAGKPLGKVVRWGTEVTVRDTWKMAPHMSIAQAGGLGALWLGVEDMSGALIDKGQAGGRTLEVFRMLREHDIVPMPMMIHHDAQPLVTLGTDAGLLNQMRLLRKAGAIQMQILMLAPTVGCKLSDKMYRTGMVFKSVGGQPTEPRMLDGNWLVASKHPKPWRKQLNLWAAYAYFYNPLRFLWSLVRPKCRIPLADPALQLLGMWGWFQQVGRTLGWALRLRWGRIHRHERPPKSPIPIRDKAAAGTHYAGAAVRPWTVNRPVRSNSDDRTAITVRVG